MSKNRERCKERVGFHFWSDFFFVFPPPKVIFQLLIGFLMQACVLTSDMTKPRKGCKEREGCHDNRNNHTNKKDKHFFKVLVGDFRKRLTIPDKFVQHFCGRPEGTVTLESPSGYTFYVEVTNKLGKLVFETGWKAFVSAHDLKMGDFLVFKYDGFSHFKVLIFDPSCCEKVLPCPLEKNKETSRETIEISSSSVEPPMKSPEGNRKVWKQKEGGFFSSSGGRKSHAVPRYILQKRTSLTDVQKQKLHKKVSAIRSGVPIYICVMRKTNISGKSQTLDISREYGDAYLLFEEQKMLLCRHGKIWEVRCRLKKNQSNFRSKRLLQGWKQFARDNYLQLGDLCLFELVNNKNYTMNVHIIREK